MAVLQEVTCRATEDGAGMASDVAGVWFPETGLWVLTQQLGAERVDVALVSAQTSPVVPLQADLSARALVDGKAYVLPLSDLMALCPDLLHRYQPSLMAQIARWAGCARLHTPTQRLAGSLLWMHHAHAQADVGWPVHCLPGASQTLPQPLTGAVSDLERAGAVHVQGAQLHVRAPDRLEALSCACHAHPPAVQAL